MARGSLTGIGVYCLDDQQSGCHYCGGSESDYKTAFEMCKQNYYTRQQAPTPAAQSNPIPAQEPTPTPVATATPSSTAVASAQSETLSISPVGLVSLTVFAILAGAMLCMLIIRLLKK